MNCQHFNVEKLNECDHCLDCNTDICSRCKAKLDGKLNCPICDCKKKYEVCLVSSYDGDAIEKIGPYNTIKEACAECRLRNKGIKSKDFPRWMFADEGEIPFENKTKE